MEALCYWEMCVFNKKSRAESHPAKQPEICAVQRCSSPGWLEMHHTIVLPQKAELICKPETVGTPMDAWEYFSEEEREKKKKIKKIQSLFLFLLEK